MFRIIFDPINNNNNSTKRFLYQNYKKSINNSKVYYVILITAIQRKIYRIHPYKEIYTEYLKNIILII